MALTVTFCEKFWSLLSKSCIWSFAFYYYRINTCTEYCRFVPRENLTWCHLVFCEHPISLQTTYSNYLFGEGGGGGGGPYFLTPVLTETQFEICRKATRPLQEHIMWTENYNIMMENVQLTGLNLFWYKKAVIKHSLSTILSYLCWTKKGRDYWVLYTFTGTEPDTVEWGHCWLLQGPQSASLNLSLSLSLSISLFLFFLYI